MTEYDGWYTVWCFGDQCAAFVDAEDAWRWALSCFGIWDGVRLHLPQYVEIRSAAG
jgi:hypothetical protein